jgi:sugar phosphate isomerase/epimerase
LDSLRREIEDGPGVLVARAVALGWSVVRDETVLKRSVAWQHELAVAVARHRVELAAIEAVVDLGRVTFASASEIVRRGVIVRLDAAIRQARRLRCRHLLVVPGLMPEGVGGGEAWRRADELLTECRVRAGLAGMRIVVERIERRSDHASLVKEEG